MKKDEIKIHASIDFTLNSFLSYESPRYVPVYFLDQTMTTWYHYMLLYISFYCPRYRISRSNHPSRIDPTYLLPLLVHYSYRHPMDSNVHRAMFPRMEIPNRILQVSVIMYNNINNQYENNIYNQYEKF